MKAIFSVLFAGILCAAGYAQVPKLSSYPVANGVIFLDFDGQVVQGTSWNWSGAINAQPSGLSANAITEIFNRVAEDYRIFNINVTTDSTVYDSAPADQRTRIIITPTWQWYGQAGGVAYVGSFAWGDETPAWVFSGLLIHTKYIAEAISHEAGHTLGLQHQSSYDSSCMKTAEYSGGQGTGEISWAPIMGVGYYKNSTTWHLGPNAYGCASMQNDIAIIASGINKVSLRNDDHANNHAGAKEVIANSGFFAASGLINSSSDKDAFRLSLQKTTHLTLSALPQSVGTNNSGANVDIRISLLNATGDTLSRYNPGNVLNAGIDTNLNSGTYYFVVEGVGNSNLSDYGSLGFYSINGSLASALAVQQLKLFGAALNGRHQLQWTYESDEVINTVEVESSTNGTRFVNVATINNGKRIAQIEVNNNAVTYYRIRLNSANGATHYSNTIAIRKDQQTSIQLTNSVVGSEIVIGAGNAYDYQLLSGSGAIIGRGRLTPGINRIETRGVQNGLFFLKVFNSVEAQGFKLIKQ
jgi:hypothetical protein